MIDKLEQLSLARCWDYRRIDELGIKRSADCVFLFITMVMVNPTSTRRLSLHFDQCVELRPENMLTLSGINLQIEPEKSSHFPEVRYRVFDAEQDAFEFLCGGFVVELDDGRSQ
ncbi:hypothetical protein [Neorhizobium sp. JUb45]|uniref:hypothetical protein n=1 Tax=unclassified Neorhizobium TaxID=2629175 RepID=UPI0010491946|nr:hypothetical protein [Neorhizobium sp. JUb45]TCR02781.1 hypothetical protein EDF70_103206 [Neorhizobium sp. JUb45]